MSLAFLLSAFIAVTLLALAGGCLFDRHLPRACLTFIAFAMTMALAWWHLGAPRLALVEITLGAWLTGGALLYALGWLGGRRRLPDRDELRRAPLQPWLLSVVAAGWLGLTGAAIWWLQGAMPRQPLLLAGWLILTLGFWAFASHLHLLRRLLAFNVLGSGIFLMLMELSGPVPEAQGLIMVALWVAWFGSLLGALLIRRLHGLDGRVSLSGGAGDRG